MAGYLLFCSIFLCREGLEKFHEDMVSRRELDGMDILFFK